MYENLIRKDSDKIIKNNADGTSECLVDLEVLVPIRYEKLQFLNIGLSVQLLDIAAIKYDDKHFHLHNNPIMISITPHATDKVMINEKEYFVFSIAKGTPFANRNCVKNDSIIKPFVEETLIKGNIMFYMDYESLRETFERFYEFTGSKIADDTVIMDIFVSLLGRTESDYKKHWRHASEKDIIAWIGIANVALSRSDGFNRITGAYLREGLVASSLDEVDNPTEVERILK